MGLIGKSLCQKFKKMNVLKYHLLILHCQKNNFKIFQHSILYKELPIPVFMLQMSSKKCWTMLRILPNNVLLCACVWSLICVKILRAVYSISSPCSNSNSNIKCQQSNANSKGTYTHTTHTVKTLQFQVSVPIKIPIFNVFLVNNFQNLIVFIGHTRTICIQLLGIIFVTQSMQHFLEDIYSINTGMESSLQRIEC